MNKILLFLVNASILCAQPEYTDTMVTPEFIPGEHPLVTYARDKLVLSDEHHHEMLKRMKTWMEMQKCVVLIRSQSPTGYKSAAYVDVARHGERLIPVLVIFQGFLERDLPDAEKRVSIFHEYVHLYQRIRKGRSALFSWEAPETPLEQKVVGQFGMELEAYIKQMEYASQTLKLLPSDDSYKAYSAGGKVGLALWLIQAMGEQEGPDFRKYRDSLLIKAQEVCGQTP